MDQKKTNKYEWESEWQLSLAPTEVQTKTTDICFILKSYSVKSNLKHHCKDFTC